MLISNSALFLEPPNPVPFIFDGHGRMSVAVEGDSDYGFGQFDIPANVATVYFIGAIIYRTVFGEAEFMPAGFKIDLTKMVWEPHWGLNWDLWEKELANSRRNNV